MTGHRPRKRFGQHFLHDPAVLARIVAAIDPRPGERIVEIGPGQGALTLPVLKRSGRLTAIELDRDLLGPLRARAEPLGELEVIAADALDVDYSALPGEGPLRLIGNLPYNISTPLLFQILESADALRDAHFMLQKEVVDRMVALPGSKVYGRLTVMLAAACAPERLFDIGPGAFQPPPRVTSSLVRLVPHADAPFSVSDPERFARLVSQAFSMRRKTLRNALKGFVTASEIEKAGIDPQARPETVTPAGFAALAAAPGA
jgi:16S rRNA (adenine1518-N6/adenine1519-N6)-dimethyltransferase